jgi:beta-lactamase superfamily II metal-dependent hydrolase
MNKLIVIFYDVGHGNCTHIITPNNQHILVDIGSLEEYSISEFLETKLGQLDMLLLTHTHKDHLYDLAALEEVGLLPRTLIIDRRAFPVKHLCNRRFYNSSNCPK